MHSQFSRNDGLTETAAGELTFARSGNYRVCRAISKVVGWIDDKAPPENEVLMFHMRIADKG
jgi:hypothetical protein